MKNSQGAVAATRIAKTGTGTEASRLRIDNTRIRRGDPEEVDYDGVAIGTSTPNSKPPATLANEKLAGVPPVTGPAASLVLPSYPVGRGISLPFGLLLPKCDWCSCNSLIAWSCRSDPSENGVMCLDHGLQDNSATRDLVMKNISFYQYSFISQEHEAAIRAFLA